MLQRCWASLGQVVAQAQVERPATQPSVLALGQLPGRGHAALAQLGQRQGLATVAGIEPLEGQGMELRLMVKLRVQNPNDAQIDYNGVALTMDVQGKTLASGVSDATGSVPRFGEAVIDVPVTISAFRMVRQAMGMAQGGGTDVTRTGEALGRVDAEIAASAG